MKKGEVKRIIRCDYQISFHPYQISYIPTTFGVSQAYYQKNYQEILSSLGLFHCSVCAHRLHRHGQRYRIVMQVWIQMFRCPECNQCVSLLPTFCIPFKHHSAQTVNEVIDLLLVEYVSRSFLYHKNYSFSVNTAKRWADSFVIFLPKLSVILSGLGITQATGNYQCFQSSLKFYFEGICSFTKTIDYFIEIQNILSGRSPPCGLFRFLSKVN